MIRHGSFAFLAELHRLRPLSGEEMTSPVTVSFENFATRAPGLVTVNSDLTLQLALDWWVHVGGAIRVQMEGALERAIQGARAVEIELLMRPDPVVAFEVDSWIKRRLGELMACRAMTAPVEIRVVLKTSERFGWVSSAPSIAAFPMRSPTSDSVDVEAGAELLGLSHLYPLSTYREFAAAMRDDIGIDMCEPPWMFWSRMAVWLKHRNRDADLSEIESRMSFFRSILSPQDEQSEAESLALGSIMMNPTFEAVERSRRDLGSREAPLLARARQGSQLTSRTITSLEALIIDHVRESFRSTRGELTAEVAQESGIRREFVERAVTMLVRDGYLLGR